MNDSCYFCKDRRSCVNNTKCVNDTRSCWAMYLHDVQPVTAIGFNVETVQYKNIKFQVWDLGGQSSIRHVPIISCVLYMDTWRNACIRPYWRCYFPNTSAVIYVIDSSDHARIPTSRTELLTMLSEDELAGVPLIVFCNKQDITGALKPEDISDQLGLAGGETKREWSVRGKLQFLC